MPHKIFRKSAEGQNICYAWTAVMHSRLDMVVCSEHDEERIAWIIDEAVATIKAIEKWGNRYDETSEVAAINRTREGYETTVSDELYALLARCQQYNADTLGLFDITATAGRKRRKNDNYVERADGGITDGLLLCGGNRVKVTGETAVDLSGILKGYALDAVMRLLRLRGIGNALVNMGNSSVGATGDGPEGDGWTVRFHTSGHAVTLRDECLTTSGNNTAQHRHIIDPRSGKLISGRRQTAVVTGNATDGEVLSTALFMASPEELLTITSKIRTKRIINLNL